MIETLKFPVSRIKIHEPSIDLVDACAILNREFGTDVGLKLFHQVTADGSKFTASWFDPADRFVEADSVVLLLAKVRRVMNGNAVRPNV